MCHCVCVRVYVCFCVCACVCVYVWEGVCVLSTLCNDGRAISLGILQRDEHFEALRVFFPTGILLQLYCANSGVDVENPT